MFYDLPPDEQRCLLAIMKERGGKFTPAALNPLVRKGILTLTEEHNGVLMNVTHTGKELVHGRIAELQAALTEVHKWADECRFGGQHGDMREVQDIVRRFIQEGG